MQRSLRSEQRAVPSSALTQRENQAGMFRVVAQAVGNETVQQPPLANELALGRAN